MIERTITVTEPEGLHTRPANRFVKEVKRFDAEVMLQCQGKEAAGRSLIKIMKLGIVQGDEVILRCSGPDEQEASDTLAAILQPE